MKTTESPPLGEAGVEGELPTLEDFRRVKLERCRLKLAAFHTKTLAAAVFRELGEASRAVLAAQGLTIDGDGVVRSEGEDQVDDQFCELVSAMYPVHGGALKLPCDVRMDGSTGRVEVVPHSHEGDAAGADGRAVRA